MINLLIKVDQMIKLELLAYVSVQLQIMVSSSRQLYGSLLIELEEFAHHTLINRLLQ